MFRSEAFDRMLLTHANVLARSNANWPSRGNVVGLLAKREVSLKQIFELEKELSQQRDQLQRIECLVVDEIFHD